MPTRKEICQKTNITEQTFHRMLKKNSDVRTIADKGRTRGPRGYEYPEEVLAWFVKRYGENAPAQDALSGSEMPSDGESAAHEVDSLQERINELEEQNAALQAKVDAFDEERRELQRQNGQILLLLAQERQQNLLQAPKKKTLRERLAAVFGKGHRPEGEGNNGQA